MVHCADGPPDRRRIAAASSPPCSCGDQVYCKFLGIFASRLALRGGAGSVEISVVRLRAEYRRIVYALTVAWTKRIV